MCGRDYWLAGLVCLLDHPFLGEEYFFWRYLHTKVAPCNHNAVGHSQDFLKVLQPFVILYLGYDLDVAAFRAQNVANVLNVFGLSDKGGSYIINILDAKVADVPLVLLCERR